MKHLNKILVTVYFLMSFAALNAQTQIHYLPDSCNTYIPKVITMCCRNFSDWRDCEIFKVYTECPFDSFQMTIYDRWGEIIFESDDIEKGWDPYRPVKFMDGVYFYRLIFVYNEKDPDSKREFLGHVTFLN